MKRTLSIILSALLTLTLLSGCGSETGKGGSTSIPNPVVQVQSASDLLSTGVSIDAPEDASEISYSVIDKKIAQVAFTYQNTPFVYRGALGSDSIDGINEEFEKESTSVSASYADYDINLNIKSTVSGGMLCLWSTTTSTYSLYTPEEFDIDEFQHLALDVAEITVINDTAR